MTMKTARGTLRHGSALVENLNIFKDTALGTPRFALLQKLL